MADRRGPAGAAADPKGTALAAAGPLADLALWALTPRSGAAERRASFGDLLDPRSRRGSAAYDYAKSGGRSRSGRFTVGLVGSLGPSGSVFDDFEAWTQDPRNWRAIVRIHDEGLDLDGDGAAELIGDGAVWRLFADGHGQTF